jgi:hypothetical protein
MMPAMPVTFPEAMFTEFRQRAATLFPRVQDEEDSLARTQFVRSSQAAGCRYRTCVECDQELKTLVANGSELWREWNDDAEQAYRLERCLYTFFMNGLSVFESMAFCLYFVGSMIQPSDFPHVQKSRKITLGSTGEAFCAAFPSESITAHLIALPQDSEFRKLDTARNLLAHRVSGMRSVRSYSVIHADAGYLSTKDETWYVPGQDEFRFDAELIHRPLQWVSSTLTTLLGVSRDFVISRKP